VFGCSQERHWRLQVCRQSGADTEPQSRLRARSLWGGVSLTGGSWKFFVGACFDDEVICTFECFVLEQYCSGGCAATRVE
jgi:hypothetical protein